METIRPIGILETFLSRPFMRMRVKYYSNFFLSIFQVRENIGIELFKIKKICMMILSSTRPVIVWHKYQYEDAFKSNFVLRNCKIY